MKTTLASSDVRSVTWKRIEAWAISERQRLREDNDSPALTPERTSHLRGRIAQLNEMLSLAEQASDSSVEPLAVFDETSTSSIAAALGGHQEDRDQ